MNYGLGIFALAELSRAENSARRDAEYASGDVNAVRESNKILREKNSNLIFRAKGQVHGLRAYLHAHRLTESELISALKAENANHPLASREAVEAAVDDHLARALLDPEVIKKTYPDGKLPDGVVFPPDHTIKVVD